MFENKPKHSYIDLFEGILIGGALAAGATLLFGTKKGKEFQKKLVIQYRKIKNTTKKIKNKLGKIVHLKTAKKIKHAVKSKVKKMAKKVRRKIKKTHKEEHHKAA